MPAEQYSFRRVACPCSWRQRCRAESSTTNAGKASCQTHSTHTNCATVDLLHVSEQKLASEAIIIDSSCNSFMQEILRQTVSACNELLRHFWAQFPLTNAKRVGTLLCLNEDHLRKILVLALGTAKERRQDSALGIESENSVQEARALDLKRALMNQHDRTTAMQVEFLHSLTRVV